AFLRRGGTLIVIGHRLTSALRARRVLTLDGASALTGDHDTLLSRSAPYRDLLGAWTVPALASGLCVSGLSAVSEASELSGPAEPARTEPSDPPLVLGDPHGLEPAAAAGLGHGPGQVV